MLKSKLQCFSLILLMWSSFAVAENSENALSFTEILSGFETISGDFTQEIKDPDGELVQKTEGEFKVKRPGYFLWKIAPPYEQLVVGTPTKLKVYDPDLEQLTVNANDSLEGSPALLISGDVKAIAEQYNIQQSNKKNLHSYTLKNKNSQDSSFDTMQFTFDKNKENYVLTSMRFVDKLGQTTHVNLKNVQNNKPFDEKVFQFVPPAGTDVIVND